jgi:hypothetical protein
MRSSLFVTTAVLFLALSTVARADDRDRYGNDDRYHDRYDNQYRGRNNGRVDAIAREIEQTAAAMHREFERNNRRPNRDEARVAATLHELHEEAYQLAHGSGRYSGRYSGSYNNRSSRSGNGVDGLLRAFDEVAYSLDRIARRPYVDRGMDRIWSLMSELDRYYGGGSSNRYDRYSRGWNTRDRGYHERYRN